MLEISGLENLSTWQTISFGANQFILYTFLSQVHDLGTALKSSSVNSRDIFERKLPSTLKPLAEI